MSSYDSEDSYSGDEEMPVQDKAPEPEPVVQPVCKPEPQSVQLNKGMYRTVTLVPNFTASLSQLSNDTEGRLAQWKLQDSNIIEMSKKVGGGITGDPTKTAILAVRVKHRTNQLAQPIVCRTKNMRNNILTGDSAGIATLPPQTTGEVSAEGSLNNPLTQTMYENLGSVEDLDDEIRFVGNQAHIKDASGSLRAMVFLAKDPSRSDWMQALHAAVDRQGDSTHVPVAKHIGEAVKVYIEEKQQMMRESIHNLHDLVFEFAPANGATWTDPKTISGHIHSLSGAIQEDNLNHLLNTQRYVGLELEMDYFMLPAKTDEDAE